MTEPHASPARAPETEDARPLVDIGWLLLLDTDPAWMEAVERARVQALETLASFSEFRFEIRLQRRGTDRDVSEPVVLLDTGAAELDAANWDFAFVITSAELRSYRKPFSLGAPASSLNVAAVSLARLGEGPERYAPPSARVERRAARLSSLALHLFGHLNDLPHSNDPKSYMFDLSSASELDEMRYFSEEGRTRMVGELRREADERIEERAARVGVVRFYVEAVWRNLSDIVHAVIKIEPWLFFMRLPRLTTTAVSTTVLLMFTAEAWDLGVRQSAGAIAAGGFGTLLVTSAYVLERQRLLRRLRNRRLTEQRAVANVSLSLGVWLGMLTTYALLFAGCFVVGRMLYSPELIARWVGAHAVASLRDYLVMSGFAATVGVALAALGASFESETYFRHVALVDEET